MLNISMCLETLYKRVDELNDFIGRLPRDGVPSHLQVRQSGASLKIVGEEVSSILSQVSDIRGALEAQENEAKSSTDP